MDKLGLSLRQKKLLHLLRGVDEYTTGDALGRQLGVSSRTIRSDVAGINKALAPYNARIISEHSKGYLYMAEDPEVIQNMNRIDNAFLTRDERVRFLAFRFCMSDTPLNIYDLEDEIFVSHTTLEHDIRQLKMKYVLSGPKIRFIQEKDALSFEQDENKRRAVLNNLFHADWDYHSRHNAYYGYDFLDADRIDRIMDIIPPILHRYDISVEDPGLVSLDLAVAIMIHRVESGHSLPFRETEEMPDPAVHSATEDLFASILEEFGSEYSEAEKKAIEKMISDARITDVSNITRENIQYNFSRSVIRLANDYLGRVRSLFGIDLTPDEDFYITLLSYLSFLQMSDRIFNEQDKGEALRSSLLPEFEIAWAIQENAAQILGGYLSETEILYLAYAISGALEFLFETHPEYKLRTVICCHLNLTAAWALKRRILGAFDKYLNIKALLPVNAKNTEDFRDVDLVLSTVRKQITAQPGTDTIQIGIRFSPKDYLAISSHIQNYRLRHLCPSGNLTIKELLNNAVWIEGMEADSKFSVIESMAERLISAGIVSPDYESDLLRREAISSFAIRHDILFLHSLVPAAETRLCIAIFSHRMSWNTFRIRVAFMGAFAPGDTPLLLSLDQFLNDPALEPGNSKAIPSPTDIIAALSDQGRLRGSTD